MTLRHTIYTALAALHLILVACGAAHEMILEPNTDTGYSLMVARHYTGSDASYGFFAPGVGPQMKASFLLIDAHGKEWTDTLEGHMTREAQLRIRGGVSRVAEFPGLMKKFGPSWAATMFGRHPTAKTVVITIEVYELPTMDEYTRGEQPRWETIYVEPFDRK